LILIFLLALLKRDRIFSKRHAWFLYLGGALGVFITVFINMAFGRISVSAILALGLLGQSITGLVFDHFGYFGMPKRLFSKKKLLGIFLILCGIISMINNLEILAVIICFAAGVLAVIARTLNAKLACVTSVRVSTFYNYLIGLAITVPVFFILGRNEAIFTCFVFSSNWYIYFGGIVGVCVVLLSNMVVVKISAFYLTLLLFIGQVFSGMLIDIFLMQAFSMRILIGGIFVTAGLCVNLLLDRSKAVQ
jgi:transporter family-2 protein